jgi:8-oxo-dGTP diphosphatase
MTLIKTVHVAVGVIVGESESEQRFFLTKRHKEAHQGGKWEFPGGKVEEGETVAQALARELKEEIAIEVLSCQPLINIEHLYVDEKGSKKVFLEVFLVDNFLNEPQAQEGQQQGWFELNELTKLNFPEANNEIVKKLLQR